MARSRSTLPQFCHCSVALAFPDLELEDGVFHGSETASAKSNTHGFASNAAEAGGSRSKSSGKRWKAPLHRCKTPGAEQERLLLFTDEKSTVATAVCSVVVVNIAAGTRIEVEL